jgi:glycosidase
VFNASYGWDWANATHNIGTGKADVGALTGYYSTNASMWPHDVMRMMMVENHDFNSWEGTQFERLGPALTNAIVLSVVGSGIPMIYNGQEAGNTRRLKFFERDPIEWKASPIADLYRRLFALKHQQPALWNAAWGAPMVRVVNSDPNKVFSFVRQKGASKIFAAFNFSAEPREVSFTDGPFVGRYSDFEGGAAVEVAKATRFSLKPWSYRVLIGR